MIWSFSLSGNLEISARLITKNLCQLADVGQCIIHAEPSGNRLPDVSSWKIRASRTPQLALVAGLDTLGQPDV
jgi:hypothetical protein